MVLRKQLLWRPWGKEWVLGERWQDSLDGQSLLGGGGISNPLRFVPAAPSRSCLIVTLEPVFVKRQALC